MYRHVLYTYRLEDVVNYTGFVNAHRYEQSELYWHCWLCADPSGARCKVQAVPAPYMICKDTNV